MLWLLVLSAVGSAESGSVLASWRFDSLESLAALDCQGLAVPELVTTEQRPAARVAVPASGITVSFPPVAVPPGLRSLAVDLTAKCSTGPVGGTVDLVVTGRPEPPRPRRIWLDDSWRNYSFRTRRWQEAPTVTLRLTVTGPCALDILRVEIREPARASYAEAVWPPVPNGGFELGLAGWGPVGTTVRVGRVVGEGSASGHACLALDVSPAAYAVAFVTDPLPQVRTIETIGVVTQSCFALEPGTRYRATASLRANADEVPVEIAVIQDAGERARATVSVGQAWEQYRVGFVASGRWGALSVVPETAAQAPGRRVWVDDVSVEPVLEPPSEEPATPNVAWDLAVGTPNSMNLFAPGETLRLLARAVSNAGGPDRLRATVIVRDFRDQPVARLERTLTLTPGGAALAEEWELPVDGNGFFTAEVSVAAGDRTARRTARLARFARYEAADSPFGVNGGWETDEPFLAARAAGIRWVRDWSSAWQLAEPSEGRRSLLTAHAFRDRYRRLGLKSLICLPCPGTTWASSVPETRWREQGVFPFAGAGAYLPDDPARLYSYVTEVARELGGRFDAFEVFQEPLVSGWAMPAAAYTATDYVAVCRDIREALKRGGWAGTVVGGPGALPGPWSMGAIRSLAGAGIAEAVDAWSVHAYLGPLPAEALADRLDELRSVAGAGPIWVTELGIWGDDEPSPLVAGIGPRPPLLSELDCAESTVRAAAILLSRGAEKVFVTAWSRALHSPGSGMDWLVTPRGEPRRVLPALAALATVLGEAPVPGPVLRLPRGTAYTFGRPAGAVAVICPAYGRSIEASTDAGAPVKWLDFCGNPTDGPAPGSLPLYAVLEEGSAVDLSRLLGRALR